MSNASPAVWYYARGGEQHGPVTAAQLRAMADAGQLAPDDLLWKEGMADWAPAREVRGLFASLPPAQPAPAPPEPPPAPQVVPPAALVTAAVATASEELHGDPPAIAPEPVPSQRSRAAGRSYLTQPLNSGALFGQPLLLVGLLAVLTGKGCDAIGNRYVVRINGELQLAKEQLTEEREKNDEPLVGANPFLAQKTDAASARAGTDKREELQKRIKELEKEARRAQANNQVAGYWREILFVLGSIVLSVGLLATGFGSQGAARWICLIMLAIITFSLYVGGIAWLSSVTSSFR